MLPEQNPDGKLPAAADASLPPAGAGESTPEFIPAIGLLSQLQANDPLSFRTQPVAEVTLKRILNLKQLAEELPFYNPDPIGRSREGHPVFEYFDGVPGSIRYVVVLPNGKALFCDRLGVVNPQSKRELMLNAAMLAALGGVIAGTGAIGCLIAAAAGAAGVNWWPAVRTRLFQDGAPQ